MSTSAALLDGSDFPDTEVPASSLTSNGQQWLSTVRARLEELLALREGWDSYGASEIQAGNANAAIELLQLLDINDGLIPEIVPTVSGSVQLEWGTGDNFIEVEVVRPSFFACLVQLGPNEPMEEFDVHFDVSPLRDRVDRLHIVDAA